ncbi:MAG: gephyrin-like molybdotransferase Glp [Pseudomonadota bacterium]
MKQLADDCFIHDKDRLKHEDALALLKDRLEPICDTEEIALSPAAGRLLAEDIFAIRPIPSTDNSAVDGYAFDHADHEPTGGFFPVVSRIAAGQAADVELPGFSAARIFTGAPMPKGADTIAMQEDCEEHVQDGTQFVVVPSGLKQRANCRLAGEDVNTGECVATKGQRLRPQDLAAIASTGSATISVFKPLRIGLLSSGDEILRPGDAFVPGKVYDANHYMLKTLMELMPVEVIDLGICPDEAKKVEALLRQSAENHDVLISSGGASRGEEDHFVNTLGKLGSCQMWQLAVKPGRPMSFGQIEQTPCFTLPGNPVAAFVCFLLYVRPALMRLGGGNWSEPTRYSLKAGFTIRSKPDRREFLRGFLQPSEDGLIAHKFDRDGSGLISGLLAASGLIEIPEAVTEISEGEPVEFLPLSEFGIIS